jgi:hypothetical protein
MRGSVSGTATPWPNSVTVSPLHKAVICQLPRPFTERRQVTGMRSLRDGSGGAGGRGTPKKARRAGLARARGQACAGVRRVGVATILAICVEIPPRRTGVRGATFKAGNGIWGFYGDGSKCAMAL